MTMLKIDTLHKLDLNLLVTLNVLLEEKNVTRAAMRLNLSQSTVSHQLAKLREAFSDPLLIPTYRGMLMTSRADDILNKLTTGLSFLEQIIQPPGEFTPQTASHSWKISASDYVGNISIYPKIANIRISAPLSRISVIDIQPQHIFEQLESREIDLAFHIASEAPQGVRARRIFSEHYVLVGRANHPKLTKSVSIETFCYLEHIIVSKSQGGFWGAADEALKKLNKERNVVVSIPDFSSLIPVIQQTDLVALIPSRLAANYPTLTTIIPPFDVPSFDISMLWSEQLHRDPAHIWLRNNFIEEGNYE